MKRLWVLILVLASGAAFACDKSAKEPSVEDVVFNNISPQTMELDDNGAGSRITEQVWVQVPIRYYLQLRGLRAYESCWGGGSHQRLPMMRGLLLPARY